MSEGNIMKKTVDFNNLNCVIIWSLLKSKLLKETRKMSRFRSKRKKNKERDEQGEKQKKRKKGGARTKRKERGSVKERRLKQNNLLLKLKLTMQTKQSVTENIAPAQAAIANVASRNKKIA